MSAAVKCSPASYVFFATRSSRCLNMASRHSSANYLIGVSLGTWAISRTMLHTIVAWHVALA